MPRPITHLCSDSNRYLEYLYSISLLIYQPPSRSRYSVILLSWNISIIPAQAPTYRRGSAARLPRPAARLRPSREIEPPVTTLDEFRDHHAGAASTSELMSLTRASVVCGDPATSDAVTAEIRRALSRSRDPGRLLDDVAPARGDRGRASLRRSVRRPACARRAGGPRFPRPVPATAARARIPGGADRSTPGNTFHNGSGSSRPPATATSSTVVAPCRRARSNSSASGAGSRPGRSRYPPTYSTRGGGATFAAQPPVAIVNGSVSRSSPASGSRSSGPQKVSATSTPAEITSARSLTPSTGSSPRHVAARRGPRRTPPAARRDAGQNPVPFHGRRRYTEPAGQSSSAHGGGST